ncbi:MAG: peptidase dimerization domain-containing protein, partial [Saccharospirillum sp.]
IPEPFGPTLLAGQVGVLWFKLGVRGKPVHVQAASTGINAIEKLQRLTPWLQDLEAELNERHRQGPYQDIDHPFNLNIGTISGGNWPSSVPAFAEMEGRIGFPPGMTKPVYLTHYQRTAISRATTLTSVKRCNASMHALFK